MEKIFVPFFIFSLNPLVGIFATAVYIWHKEKIQTSPFLYIFALFISIFLGLQNIGKEMAGDIVAYKDIFLSVPQYGTIIDYMLSFGKEPIYYGSNYIAYYLLGGNWSIFIFCITVLNYMLLSYTIIKIGEILQTEIRNIVVTLFVLLFFFQEFASCGHMIRQCLAQSIIAVFIVSWYIEGRKRWWIAILALGVHTSSLPIIGIGMIPALKERITIKRGFIIGSMITILVCTFYYFSSVLANVPFLSHIVERANQSSLMGTDTWQKQVGLDVAALILITIICIMIAYVYKKMDEQLLQNEKNVFDNEIMYPYINITMVIICAVIVWDMINAYYLVMRYFFYIYAFFFGIILLFLHYWNPKTKYVYTSMGISFLFLYYIHYYINGKFHYYPLIEMLFHPTFLYV